MTGVIEAAMATLTTGDMTAIVIVTGTAVNDESGERIGARIAASRSGGSTSVGRIGTIVTLITPLDTPTTAMGGLVNLALQSTSLIKLIRCFGLARKRTLKAMDKATATNRGKALDKRIREEPARISGFDRRSGW